MVAGRLVPGDVGRLMRGLDVGYVDGSQRPRGGARVLETAMAPFKPFSGPRRASVLIAGRIWQREKLRSEAARRVAGGEIATLMLLSPKALFHHVRFHEDG